MTISMSTKARLSTLTWILVLAIGGGIAWWALYRAEPARLTQACLEKYALARTSAESLVVDEWAPEGTLPRSTGSPVKCRTLLRGKKPSN